LDLSEVDYVCPLDLVGLTIWSNTLPPEARGNVLLPRGDAASYLERMNVLQLLRGGGWTVPETGPEKREKLVHRLLEVTPLVDRWAVEDLADQLPKLFTTTNNRKRARALHDRLRQSL
jgi:hypothetical protein